MKSTRPPNFTSVHAYMIHPEVQSEFIDQNFMNDMDSSSISKVLDIKSS